MSFVTLLGLAGAGCTTFCFLPQVVKAWKTRHTADVSLAMFLMMAAGQVLWLAYGFAINDVPLIAANIISLGFSAVILYFKFRYG